MKKLVVLVLSLLFIGGVGISFAKGGGKGGDDNGSVDRGNMQTLINTFPKKSLDKGEREGLLLMREEEKLARDVYGFLYDKWNLRTFQNIGKSEQTHMDAIKLLLDRYSLSDPIRNDARGVFEDKNLQDLYNKLTTKGSRSLLDALYVGATIEDLDIYDLLRLIKGTDNDDIKVVYQNLEKGSRNHLRSFMKQIKANGGNYTPQYISKMYFDKIINTSNERGMISDPNFKF